MHQPTLRRQYLCIGRPSVDDLCLTLTRLCLQGCLRRRLRALEAHVAGLATVEACCSGLAFSPSALCSRLSCALRKDTKAINSTHNNVRTRPRAFATFGIVHWLALCPVLPQLWHTIPPEATLPLPAPFDPSTVVYSASACLTRSASTAASAAAQTLKPSSPAARRSAQERLAQAIPAGTTNKATRKKAHGVPCDRVVHDCEVVTITGVLPGSLLETQLQARALVRHRSRERELVIYKCGPLGK